MTVVVLGATGMLGHVVTRALRDQGRVVVAQGRTPRGSAAVDEGLRLLDVGDRPALVSLLADWAPCVVINCTVAKPGSQGAALRAINVDLPQWLAGVLEERNWGRLVHISTDGVFSTQRIAASEDDLPDPSDDYGRSKLAGEVTRAPHLTIRASIIGPEPRNRSGLFEWFRNGDTSVTGFSGVLWNGVTTLEMARFLGYCLDEHVSGLVHLAGETVTKLELLALIRRLFRVERELKSSDEPHCTRTLSSSRRLPGFALRSLSAQLDDLRRWEARAEDQVRH